MNHATASAILKKILLYHFVREKYDELNCFRCGKFIHFEDFSIDHKKPWMSSPDPVFSFFDLDNISFSHLDCNSLESGTGRPTRASAEKRLKSLTCGKGHLWSKNAWYHKGHKGRICRTCKLESKKARYHANKQGEKLFRKRMKTRPELAKFIKEMGFK